jgi:hypothetical protein
MGEIADQYIERGRRKRRRRRRRCNRSRTIVLRQRQRQRQRKGEMLVGIEVWECGEREGDCRWLERSICWTGVPELRLQKGKWSVGKQEDAWTCSHGYPRSHHVL